MLILKELRQILSDAEFVGGKRWEWMRSARAVVAESQAMVAEDYLNSIVISAKRPKIEGKRSFREVERRRQFSANISSVTVRKEQSKPA